MAGREQQLVVGRVELGCRHPQKVEITCAGMLLREIVEAYCSGDMCAVQRIIEQAREFLQE